ncbi:FHA domain-containing protein [Verrucomicrobium sp. GAS474]|uniref:FHA domain-containing protein n=1 Tax=Verrucomicrobium sp. GAS474 TaxID=1882831 RepID=UPI00087BF973|nr:FHA domain-containing protein [Verrucomicrobium sp. GAS474]SDU28087.1 FHA domain-containing protein [Verrucomicrobium sp. GAS474]
MPRFIGQNSDFANQVFDLAGQKITVGRTPDNALHLPDNSISSHHAELNLEAGDYIVTDLESTNGSRVNGEKIQTSPLRQGDTVRFGNVDLLYESENSPAETPLPELRIGIPLDQSVSRGRPSHFSGTTAATRSKSKESGPWPLILGAVGLLALGAVGYALFVLFTTK